jgi:hypothetical protein
LECLKSAQGSDVSKESGAFVCEILPSAVHPKRFRAIDRGLAGLGGGKNTRKLSRMDSSISIAPPAFTTVGSGDHFFFRILRHNARTG